MDETGSSEEDYWCVCCLVDSYLESNVGNWVENFGSFAGDLDDLAGNSDNCFVDDWDNYYVDSFGYLEDSSGSSDKPGSFHAGGYC